MEFENYIDISPLVSPQTAVFPGDTPFSKNLTMDYSKGDHLQLSSITTTTHIGAHADAPIHYHPDGESIDSRSLDLYMGECQVINIDITKSTRICLEHLTHTKVTKKRILFKTNSFPNANEWNQDFNFLDSTLISELAKKGVVLIGIDTPSIDSANDKTLKAHKSIFKNNMAILEGLVLSHVKEGNYILMALPIKLKDCEASPVRAVLFPEKSSHSFSLREQK